MIIQHPMLWCAIALMAGIAVGLNFPSTLCLPLLVAVFVACYLTRKTRHLHDVLTLLVWGLLGCSRASIGEGRWIIGDGKVKIENRVASVQSALTARLEKSGVSPRTLALCSALVVGRKDGLKRETRQAYNRAGAGHLLALSGMHLGVLYGLMHLLFLRWVRPTRWRWHALPLMLAAIWGYALLTGFPVSLVRASVMLSVMTIGSLAERGVPSLHTLSLAALVILLCSPDAVMDVGFQLSFLSVLFILTLYVPVQQRYHRLFSGWGLLLRPIGVSLAAQIGTAPLCLYYFHSLPLGAVAINLLMVPLTTAIIYLGVAALVWPATMLVSMLATVVKAELWLIKGWTALPHLTIHDIYVPRLMVVLLYALLLCAILRLHLQLKDDDFA